MKTVVWGFFFCIFAGKVRMFSKSPDLSDIAQNTESLALVSKLQLMGEHFMVENSGIVFFYICLVILLKK